MADLVVKVDAEFQSAARKLNEYEIDFLQQKLQTEGCLEEFVYTTIDGENLQLDGHHRREICDNFSIPYAGWRRVECKNREEALEWIAAHQSGRRNQSASESKALEKFIRGIKYLKMKKGRGRPARQSDSSKTGGDVSSDNSVTDEGIKGETAENVAKEENVSRATVERDAEFAAKILEKFCDRCKRLKKPSCDDCRKILQDAIDKKNQEPEKKKPEKPPEPPKPVLDQEKHEVPKRLLTTFATLEKFKEADSLCQKLQKIIHEISECEGGEQLHFFLQATGNEEKVIRKSEHLNALKRDLKGTRPHSICPNCKGRGCNTCNKSGWVTKITWDSFDEKVKESIK